LCFTSILYAKLVKKFAKAYTLTISFIYSQIDASYNSNLGALFCFTKQTGFLKSLFNLSKPFDCAQGDNLKELHQLFYPLRKSRLLFNSA